MKTSTRAGARWAFLTVLAFSGCVAAPVWKVPTAPQTVSAPAYTCLRLDGSRVPVASPDECQQSPLPTMQPAPYTAPSTWTAQPAPMPPTQWSQPVPPQPAQWSAPSMPEATAPAWQRSQTSGWSQSEPDTSADDGASQSDDAPAQSDDEPAPRRAAGRGHVMCCDGTASPTCGCGRASFRGCCSHHDGVCGGCE